MVFALTLLDVKRLQKWLAVELFPCVGLWEAAVILACTECARISAFSKNEKNKKSGIPVINQVGHPRPQGNICTSR